MAYGKVQETFWHDPRMRASTERARHLFLYLLTSPHRNRLGLYVLDDLYASSDLQWTEEDVQAARAELERIDRVRWDPEHRVVLLVRWFRHNTLENLNVVKGALADVRRLPETPLLLPMLEELRRHVEEDVEPKTRSKFDLLLRELASRASKLSTDERQRGLGVPQPTPAAHLLPNHNEEADLNRTGNRSETVTRTVTPTVSNSVDRIRSQAVDRDLAVDRVRDRNHPPPTPPTVRTPSEARTVRTDVEPRGDAITSEKSTPNVDRWLELARENIAWLHGDSFDAVSINGHEVGIGIDLLRFRKLARALPEGSEIVARAIRFLPEVTTLERPISLARWVEADDGHEVLAQCLHRALESTPSSPLPTEVDMESVPHGTASPAAVEAERIRQRRAITARIEERDQAESGSPEQSTPIEPFHPKG